ncbi:MAG: riboflavin synthase [Planctomycetota bacterium]|nr:riboflavin synthase [Planctomycetota bacterium]
MFTGLVEAKVPLIETLAEGTGKRMGFDLGTVSHGVRIGDSIALNGCCLTVVAIQGTQCWFELGAETLARTSLGKLEISDFANCERALKVGDRLGGHYVTGHIDGQGVLDRRLDEGEWSYFYFKAPLSLLRQMASKGSITVDGVSLTLVDANDEFFSVALIPHTLSNTTLGGLQVGDQVNLETDILAKYVQRALGK